MGRSTSTSRRYALSVLLSIVALASPASASTDIAVNKTGLVKASPEHVLAVLASNDICDEGCKYHGPHIAQEVKLAHRAGANEFFKWTHVSGIKTVKFFKHFKVTRGAVWKIEVRTLQEKADARLIEELEKKSGKEHDPLFELSTATYTLTPQGDMLEVEIRTMTRIGGLLRVLSGTVRKEAQKSLDSMFENFSR